MIEHGRRILVGVECDTTQQIHTPVPAKRGSGKEAGGRKVRRRRRWTEGKGGGDWQKGREGGG
jgi:hypothetical protein